MDDSESSAPTSPFPLFPHRYFLSPIPPSYFPPLLPSLHLSYSYTLCLLPSPNPPSPSSPQANFEDLQPDSVSGQIMKYAKSVYQLEKGLPPNGVVPKLKAKVEDMKDKVH